MALLPAAGQRFGRYELGRRLGHGGMGVVHVATDTTLNREVALKLVTPHLAEDPEFRSRFTREAMLLARLDSPHIVSIHDHGEQDGVLYIATQLIDGGDLTALVDRAGRLSPAAAVEIVTQVTEALGDAHTAGVTHRDVKPANVLVRRRGERTEAFLCDFGIATAADARITRTGGVSGSLSWMAPERHRGEDAGVAGDIYSAGCLLWFALTGSAPYDGTDVEVALGHLEGAIPQLPGTDPLSTRINTVLTRAMAKEPERRYADAAAMHADLAALQPHATGPVVLPDVTSIRQPLASGRGSAPETVVRGNESKGRRRRAVVWLGTVAAVLALVGGTVGVWTAVADRNQGRPTDDPTLTAGETMLPSTPGSTPRPTHKAGRRGAHAAAKDRPAAGSTAGVTVPGAEASPQGTVHHAGPSASAARTTRPPAAASTAPESSYSCWNGQVQSSLAACGTPKGVAGARWMVSGLPSCYTASPSSSLVVESYGCDYGPGKIYVLRATSVSAARQYLLKQIPTNRVEGTWQAGGAYGGHSFEGRRDSGSSLPPYRWGRYWDSDTGPWLFLVVSKTVSGRTTGIDKFVHACRPVADIRGVAR